MGRGKNLIEFITEKGLDNLHDARRIRQIVFVEEQGFVVEFDDIDEIATHTLLTVDGIPAGTGRVFPKEDNVYIIGRIAVLPQYRGRDLGKILVQELEEIAKVQKARTVVLSAQVRVKEFYEKMDYTAIGDAYLDEGCPHIKMQKTL